MAADRMGPSVRRTLQRMHPDTFVQAAIMRLYAVDTAVPAEQGAPFLQADVVSQLQRAERVDGVTTSGAEQEGQ